jgi:hypothetical protein
VIKIKNVTSDVLFIAPGDTLLLTFGKDYDLDQMETVAKRIAEVLPENKIIVNLEGLMTDIKIIKEDSAIPFVTGLTTESYKAPSGDYKATLDYITTSNTKEFKLNDYIY